MANKLTWTDVEDIAIELNETHKNVDPLHVRFTDLRKYVQALPDFEPTPDKHVNEQILEAIQAAWIEERQDTRHDDDDDDKPGYKPPVAFKPD